MNLPLAGVRVLTVEQFGAGPYGSAHLADMGAEVIKIENRQTGGDLSRQVGPLFLGADDSQFYQTFNRNKRSLSLNLKTPEGREILERLVAGADAVFGNLRGDQPEKLGLTYADLAPINPRLVCAHISAYGNSGSRKGWPGFDYLVQAESGFLSLTGEPNGPPARFGLSMVDYMTGMTAAFALLSALHAARETGLGRDVQVSLYDTAMHQLTYPATWYLNDGLETTRQPRSAHPYVVPSQLFRTRDGWVFIMCQSPKFWGLFCDRIGRADLAEDADFRDDEARHRNRDRLTEILDAVLETEDTETWIGRLAGAVPCGPVYDLGQALDNPFLAEREGIQAVDHPDRPGLKMVANPIRIGAPIPDRPAPKLGADTDDLLAEIGYDETEIASLRDAGVV
ncbi:MAG: CoA transferase [Alphaproteobacteria bacterium]|jgi:crotonobetainyl-CoA:carnitine CoA-transferase CaiB-like acyl-CoA transferase|nr:CoA transferase [Alphaproteobacteria bacterium]MDP6517598.1 CoA transferase [Alphaproteobacteria bacterium]